MKRGRRTTKVISMMVATIVTVAAGSTAALAYMSEAESCTNRVPVPCGGAGCPEINLIDSTWTTTPRGTDEWSICRNLCSSEPSCEAWSYRHWGTDYRTRERWGWCSLYDNSRGLAKYYSTDHWSGVKIPDDVRMSDPHYGQWIPYNMFAGWFGGPRDEAILRSLDVWSTTTCEDECAIEDTCTAWNYFIANYAGQASCILLKTEEIETQSWPRGTLGLRAICGYKE